MTKRLDASLKLSLPRALTPRVVDHLLQHPDWVGPFTMYRIEGHGAPEGIIKAAEKVRGYADLMQIEILMDSSHVADLLADLRTDLPSKDVVWWLSPVLQIGTLG